jgi:2'-5' RNA ligase
LRRGENRCRESEASNFKHQTSRNHQANKSENSADALLRRRFCAKDVPAAIPERLRLFIAIAIPEVVRAQLADVQAELRRALPGALIRWTRHEQLHLTLKFLGDVEAQRFPMLEECVRAACVNFSHLSLRCERIGCFPHLRSPRVIWASIRDHAEQLQRLHGAIEAASQPFTSEEPEKPFSAHVTLGRVKRMSRSEMENLRRLACALADKSFGEWTAEHAEIMRSELSAEGARHVRMATVPLSDRS